MNRTKAWLEVMWRVAKRNDWKARHLLRGVIIIRCGDIGVRDSMKRWCNGKGKKASKTESKPENEFL